MKETVLVKEVSESPIMVLGQYSRNICNVLVLFLYLFLTPLISGQCCRLNMRLYEPLIKPRTISHSEKEKKKFFVINNMEYFFYIHHNKNNHSVVFSEQCYRSY